MIQFLVLALIFPLLNAQGVEYQSEEPICLPLHVASGVSVIPPTCTHDEIRAGVVCSFSCNEGYHVHGPPIKECTDQGTWTDSHINISCTDLNECRIRNGGCSHTCVNTVGSYRCECPSHLKLHEDGKSCKAEGLQLTCGTKDMRIVIPKNIIHNLHHEHLRLNDPSCVATSNKTHYILSTKLTGCGTTSRQIKSYIVYSNKVSEEPDRLSNKIGRVLKGEVQVPFCCYFHNQEIVHAVGMRPGNRELYIKVKGRGKLKLKLDFYKSKGYGSVYTWDDFPVSMLLRQRLYFEVSLKTKEKDLEIFADNCCSTPTRDHEKSKYLRHTFIHNGCPTDRTVRFHSSPSRTTQRFSLEAFKFLGDHPFVFVHCHVLVCDAKDPHSRCKKGCIPGNPGGYLPHGHSVAKKPGSHAVHKRDVSVSSLKKMSAVTLSQGPFLVDEETKKGTKREEIPKPKIIKEKNVNQNDDYKEEKETRNREQGFPNVSSVLLIGLTVASAVALIGVIYISFKSRHITPFGYNHVSTKSDLL